MLAIVCGLIISSPQFAYAKHRKYRTAMYSTALPLGLAIVYHVWLMYDGEEYRKRLALGHLRLVAWCHLIGAIFYVTRVSTHTEIPRFLFDFAFCSRVASSSIESRAHPVDFVQQIPERWYPVRFDLVGASHQVFHLMVVLAALVHVKGLLHAFAYAHGKGLQCPTEACKSL